MKQRLSANLTNSWVSFWTNAWVDCASFSSSSYLSNNSFGVPQWKVALTVSAWVYYTSVTNNLYSFFSMWATWHKAFANANCQPINITDYWNDVHSSVNAQQWQWYHIALTAEQWNNNWKIYVNCVDVTSWWAVSSYAWIGWTNFRINWFFWQSWYGINWYMSNFIVENATRTAQEISDYYNQTKSLYWIS